MGSTKVEICEALQAAPPHIQVIGGHPMCGKEQAGLAAAEPDLYQDCTYVVSPLPRTTESSMHLMLELVQYIGARPLVLEPDRHDRLVAAISHLPYVVSSALVAHVAAVGEQDAQVWDVAASGFRDTSRVAASEVKVMLDILLTNRSAVLAAIEDYQERLAGLHELLEGSDEVGLQTLLVSSAEARKTWKKGN
jgi:prephenate dehydrogenase